MTGSATSPLRLDSDLIAAAKREGSIKKRSVPKQIEYWADLGKAVEHVLDYNDIFAVIQGLKKIKVEPVKSSAVDPSDIFNSLEDSRKSKNLAEKVTSAAVYFEASRKRPGLLDKVNTATGERQTGKFCNGEFKI
jgi:hypothetical protein